MTRMLSTVLVDLDNTIYDYDGVRDRPVVRLAGWISGQSDVSRSAVRDAYEHIVAESSGKLFGSGRDMRTTRMEALAVRLNVRFDVPQAAALIGEWLLEEVRPYRGALEALSVLYRHHRLLIVSEGYSDIQGAIAAKLGIATYELFATFAARTRKIDGSAYQFLIADRGVEPGQTVMIGDNWPKDVVAPSRFGISTVWISHARPTPDSPPAGFRGAVAGLAAAPALLDPWTG